MGNAEAREGCQHPRLTTDGTEQDVLEGWAEVGPAHVHGGVVLEEGEAPDEPEQPLTVEQRTVRCPDCEEPVTQQRIAGEE